MLVVLDITRWLGLLYAHFARLTATAPLQQQLLHRVRLGCILQKGQVFAIHVPREHILLAAVAFECP